MRRTFCIFLATLCLSVVCVTFPLVVGRAVNPPGAPNDHFLGYKAAVTKRTQDFSPLVGLRLVDLFEDRLFDVKSVLGLFLPADKNGEGVIDPRTHLVAYRITESKVCADTGVTCNA